MAINLSKLNPGDFIRAVDGDRAMFVARAQGKSDMIIQVSENLYRAISVPDSMISDATLCNDGHYWNDSPDGAGNLAGIDDIGTVVYDQDGDPCLLIQMHCGPAGECVVGYGGEMLGWAERCFVPLDQDDADEEYAALTQAAADFEDGGYDDEDDDDDDDEDDDDWDDSVPIGPASTTCGCPPGQCMADTDDPVAQLESTRDLVVRELNGIAKLLQILGSGNRAIV